MVWRTIKELVEAMEFGPAEKRPYGAISRAVRIEADPYHPDPRSGLKAPRRLCGYLYNSDAYGWWHTGPDRVAAGADEPDTTGWFVTISREVAIRNLARDLRYGEYGAKAAPASLDPLSTYNKYWRDLPYSLDNPDLEQARGLPGLEFESLSRQARLTIRRSRRRPRWW